MSYSARITSNSGALRRTLTLGVEGAEANADRLIIMAWKENERRKRAVSATANGSRGKPRQKHNPR